jgi:hypothetical protein
MKAPGKIMAERVDQQREWTNKTELAEERAAALRLHKKETHGRAPIISSTTLHTKHSHSTMEKYMQRPQGIISPIRIHIYFSNEGGYMNAFLNSPNLATPAQIFQLFAPPVRSIPACDIFLLKNDTLCYEFQLKPSR